MIKLIRKAVLASLGIFPFLTPAEVFTDSDYNTPDLLATPNQMPWRKSRLILDVQTGSRTVSTADVMIPFLGNDDFLVYANVMANYSTALNNANGNQFETNLGFGFRRVNDDEDAIYGAYAFYDSMTSVNNNNFHQVTVGAERLGLTWDFRVNAYLPVGETSFTGLKNSAGSAYYDDNLLYASGIERTETIDKGVDVEVGRTLFSKNLRAYLAAYSFGGDVTGPRARVQYQLNDTITFTASLQHDKARGTQYYLGTQITLGGVKTSAKNSIYSRLTDKVQRDVDIVSTIKDTSFTKTSDNNFYFVDPTASDGVGTEDSPYNSIQEAVNAAPDDSVIFIKGKEGKTYTDENDIELKKGQILWGASSNLYWNYKTSSIAFDKDDNNLLIHEAVGKAPVINGTINIDYDSDIYNLVINPGSKGGIVVNDATTTVQNVTVQGEADLANNGIEISGKNASVTLNQVHISHVDTAVLIDSGSLVIKGTNETPFINNSNTGIKGEKVAHVTVDGPLDINGVVNNGIELHEAIFSTNDNVTINGVSNNVLASTMSAPKVKSNSETSGGIYLDDATYNSTSGSTTINYVGNGIYANEGSRVNLGGDLTITHSKADGIHLEDSVSYNNVEHATMISYSGANGVSIAGNDHTEFSTSALTISDSGESGLSQSAGELSITGATSIINSGQEGFSLEGVRNANLESITVSGGNQYGIKLINSNLTITGGTTVSGSTVSSFSATDMTADNTTNFGSLTINQTGGEHVADAFTQDGGVVNLNGTTNISGQNTYGIHLTNGTNLTATGAVTISGSTEYGYYQEDGSTTIEGITKISGDATTMQDGFYAAGAEINLNNITINPNKDTTTFARGVSINGGHLKALGDVTVNNANNTGVEFKDVTMNSGDEIASIDVSGANQYGVKLTSSDFTVAGLVDVSGSSNSAFYADDMGEHTVTLASAVNLSLGATATGYGFYQGGGNVIMDGITTIKGNNNTVEAQDGFHANAATVMLNGALIINPTDTGATTHFNNGLSVTGGSIVASNITINNVKNDGVSVDSAIFSSGAIVVNNASVNGIDFSGVTMGDGGIASVTVAGVNNVGVKLANSDFTVTGLVDVSGSSNSAFYADEMSNENAVNLGDVNLSLGSEATGYGYYQEGGTINIDGVTTISGGETATASKDAFHSESATVRLHDTLTINPTKTGTFFNGLFVKDGSFSAKGITIYNTSNNGIAFTTVTMLNGGINGDLTIDGNNLYGVKLTKSDFIVAGLVNILNAKKYGFYAYGDNEYMIQFSRDVNITLADNAGDNGQLVYGYFQVGGAIQSPDTTISINNVGGDQSSCGADGNGCHFGTAFYAKNTSEASNLGGINIENLGTKSTGISLENTNLTLQNNVLVDGLGVKLGAHGFTGIDLKKDAEFTVMGNVSIKNNAQVDGSVGTGIQMGKLGTPSNASFVVEGDSVAIEDGNVGISMQGSTLEINSGSLTITGYDTGDDQSDTAVHLFGEATLRVNGSTTLSQNESGFSFKGSGNNVNLQALEFVANPNGITPKGFWVQDDKTANTVAIEGGKPAITWGTISPANEVFNKVSGSTLEFINSSLP